MSEIRTLGLALKSTVSVMGDLGYIGEEVLAAHHINHIDPTATYPGVLRQEIHEAAYQRFGAAALLNFGFAMYDDYSFDVVNQAAENYGLETKNTTPTAQALDAIFQVIISHLDASMKRGHQHEKHVYGVASQRIKPYVYSIQAAASGIGQALSQSFGSFDKNSDVANGCDLILIQQVPQSNQLRLGLGGIDVMHYRRAQKTLDWIESPRNGISSHPSSDPPLIIKHLEYARGDRLLICTDGLTDQVGGQERLRSFGYGRTQAIFETTQDQSVDQVLSALVDALEAWRGLNERRDDVTLVCIDL